MASWRRNVATASWAKRTTRPLPGWPGTKTQGGVGRGRKKKTWEYFACFLWHASSF
jgi:hypothetical protein